MAIHSHSFEQRPNINPRVARGRRSYHAGQAAEASVERHYVARGHICIARRWRAGPGELDLVFDGPEGIVVVEVKQSGTFDQALARITQAQAQRLFDTAEMFVDTLPMGTLTERRFDVAAVNGQGEVQIHENFFAGGF